MAIRNPGNDDNLLKLQYLRLRDALGGYYSGKGEQVLNVATTLRVLIHDKPSSRSLLFRLNPDYWDLAIYDKPPLHPRAVFAVRTPIRMTGGGESRIIRPTFGAPYQMVSLQHWWNSDYQPLGPLRLSKRTIVLNVADKDGGAHVDDRCPTATPLFLIPHFASGWTTGVDSYSCSQTWHTA
jgi:hypothetical protein